VQERVGRGAGAVVPFYQREREAVGEERADRWTLSVRERKREGCGLFPQGCCWVAASGRPSWAVLFFFSLLSFELAKLI
jgi:hypothetical protein